MATLVTSFFEEPARARLEGVKAAAESMQVDGEAVAEAPVLQQEQEQEQEGLSEASPAPTAPGSEVKVTQAESQAGVKKTTRLTGEQRTVLQASFAACPRPSVAQRKELAASLGLENGTVNNWFEAERRRTGLGLLPKEKPPASAETPTPAHDEAEGAMRKRKAASGYEVPCNEAARGALVGSLDAEEAELAEALQSPTPNWFALLPPPASALASGPQLQRAVAALAEDARMPLSAQVDALTSALATACGACGVPSPAPEDVRSALLAVADRRAFTAAHPAGAPADPEGLGEEARWVVRDLKLLPADGVAREDAAQRRARREAALRRQGGIAAVRAALAMSPDAPGAAALLAASLAALNAASVCLGDHDAAADKARRRREERRAKEAAAGAAGASPDGDVGDGGGDAACDASAMGASPSAKKAKVVLSDEEKAAKAADKAAKDAEKAAKAEEKALKDADKALKAADKAAKDAKASAAAARQANMLRGFFGAKPPAAPPQASPGAAPSQPSGGASADAAAGVAAVQAGGAAPAAATALVASALPSEGALAAMDARLSRRLDAPPARDVLAAHMCAWRPTGAGAGGRAQARRWGARRASRRDRHFDPLRAGGTSVGVAAAEDDAPAAAAARRKLLQVDTSELRFELGPAAFLAPPTGGPKPLEKHPRPAYWGTWPPDRPKTAAPALRRGRRPLALGPGLDYELDSAEEWEEEEPGESLNGDSDGEREEEDPMAVSDIDEGDGFVVADDYLSEDERAEDVVPTPGEGDASAMMGGCAAESARAKAAERLRAEVDVRAERARKQGKMLIVSSLHVAGAAAGAAPEPDAAAAAAASICTPPPMAPQATGAHLLQGYAVEAFSKHVIGRPASAADAVAPPSHAPNAAVGLGGGASGAPEGGSARGRKVSSFPEDLAPALVRLMLASPGVQVVKLTDEFVSGAGAKRATKVATKERVNALGKYEKGRWELSAEALLLIDLSREQADATRPPPPPKQPRAPKPKPAAPAPPTDSAPAAVAAVAEAPAVEAEAEAEPVAMEE